MGEGARRGPGPGPPPVMLMKGLLSVLGGARTEAARGWYPWNCDPSMKGAGAKLDGYEVGSESWCWFLGLRPLLGRDSASTSLIGSASSE